MILKRLRTCLSVMLALVLVCTSGLQTARAWVDGSSTKRFAIQHGQSAVMQTGMPGDHGSHNNRLHDGHGGHSEHAGLHTATTKADQDQTSCLMVCLDAYPHYYLNAQFARTAAPELVAIYPFALDQISGSTTCQTLASLCRAARGPPRSPVDRTDNDFRKLLLLQTARFRI